jgi:hypothetical protein
VLIDLIFNPDIPLFYPAKAGLGKEAEYLALILRRGYIAACFRSLYEKDFGFGDRGSYPDFGAGSFRLSGRGRFRLGSEGFDYYYRANDPAITRGFPILLPHCFQAGGGH